MPPFAPRPPGARCCPSSGQSACAASTSGSALSCTLARPRSSDRPCGSAGPSPRELPLPLESRTAPPLTGRKSPDTAPAHRVTLAPMSTVSSGPLVLADLSGYTSYLGGVELEHSHDVLADLLETVVGALRGALAIDKLEGDAVFCVGSGGGLELAVLEDCYAAFARRRFSIAQATP